MKSVCGQGGQVCYDIVRAEQTRASNSPPKVLFIIPGVNSSIEDHHINATVRHAVQKGYNCVVVNPVRPSLAKGISDLEVIDYSRVEPITESI